MNDEYEKILQSMDKAEADPPVSPEAPDPAIVHLPLFRPGTRVAYQGQEYTVGHVVVCRSLLKVFLQELGDTIDADRLRLAPTRLILQRT